jgi:hypothetical protein
VQMQRSNLHHLPGLTFQGLLWTKPCGSFPFATCILFCLRDVPSTRRPIPHRTLPPHNAQNKLVELRGTDSHETGGMQQSGGHVLALPVVKPLPAASFDGATAVLVLGHRPLASPAYRRNRPGPTQSPVEKPRVSL